MTYASSPYQVKLFDAVAAQGEIDLHVVYLIAHDTELLWKNRLPKHSFVSLDPAKPRHDQSQVLGGSRDLLVVNYYRHRFVNELLKSSAIKETQWVFWGERPRVHALSIASKVYRAWKLRALHQSQAPIWGMGRLAVEAYRREFGDHRTYVNLPYFSDLLRFSDEQKKERECASSDRAFLFSGALTHRKGADLVAKGFVRLRSEGFSVRLKLMGAGAMEHDLRQILANCRDRVEFVGFCDWDELPEVYATADVLCVPSRYDGWGLVVPEGLAAGLPVISTKQTGAAVEFIQTGRNGWLVAPNDGEAVYHAMRAAASIDPGELYAMSSEARASVAGHSLVSGASRFIQAAKAAMENS